LSEYKKKRDADKKKETFKTLGNNGATADIRVIHTAYLTAENFGVKVTVLIVVCVAKDETSVDIMCRRFLL
jgi:hypothetical protein